MDQTKVMDIMELIKNRKWTWVGHISRRKDNRWRVQDWQFGHLWVVKETKEAN